MSNESKEEREAKLRAQKDWRDTSQYDNPYKKGSLESLAYNLEFTKLAKLFNCEAYNYA